MKLAPDLGVGIGFFPPDNASLNQFGNRDGTIETPNGLRPTPLRYIRSHLNTSYFSVLGAVGYRVADWLRIGFGAQWQLVVFQSRSFTPAVSISGLWPGGDVKSEAFGRDLFVPGLIGSVHITPFDALDIALGFKWSDRVMGKAKLDLTASAFGTGEAVTIRDPSGLETTLPGTVPYTVHNQKAEVSAGPVWVPQLSAAIRFADRLKPRVKDKDWGATMKAGGGTEEDSMATERWDIELDVIYYLTSFQDRTDVFPENVTIELRTINGQGMLDRPVPISVGDCVLPNRMLVGDEQCQRNRVRTKINGKDQLTFRLGGDYNILPGLFTVRAGVSHELDGQDPEWMTPFQYMASRTGLHTGVTLRLAQRTDLSFGLAYFIQKEVTLQVNDESLGDYRAYFADRAKYHFPEGDLDGMAKVEIPHSTRTEPGPYYVNSGSYFYDLTVLSASISQRF
jgi:hypothetical protein